MQKFKNTMLQNLSPNSSKVVHRIHRNGLRIQTAVEWMALEQLFNGLYQSILTTKTSKSIQAIKISTAIFWHVRILTTILKIEGRCHQPAKDEARPIRVAHNSPASHSIRHDLILPIVDVSLEQLFWSRYWSPKKKARRTWKKTGEKKLTSQGVHEIGRLLESAPKLSAKVDVPNIKPRLHRTRTNQVQEKCEHL